MPDEDDNLVEGPSPSLTEEEARVMKLVSEGRTTQEVADELGISPPTAAERMRSTLSKLEKQAD
jgi:DNA-binding CsgD family transcriptional regulator